MVVVVVVFGRSGGGSGSSSPCMVTVVMVGWWWEKGRESQASSHLISTPVALPGVLKRHLSRKEIEKKRRNEERASPICVFLKKREGRERERRKEEGGRLAPYRPAAQHLP